MHYMLYRHLDNATLEDVGIHFMGTTQMTVVKAIDRFKILFEDDKKFRDKVRSIDDMIQSHMSIQINNFTFKEPISFYN